MFKPSPILGARLRLTTKQVNGGYYKGNRTGSMGSHTEYGGYIIDYRKVRHFNCPDLTNFKLTPFITKQMEPTERTQTRPDGTTFTPKLVDGKEYLRQWRRENLDEYEQVLAHQNKEASTDISEPEDQAEALGDLDSAPEKMANEKISRP